MSPVLAGAATTGTARTAALLSPFPPGDWASPGRTKNKYAPTVTTATATRPMSHRRREKPAAPGRSRSERCGTRGFGVVMALWESFGTDAVHPSGGGREF